MERILVVDDDVDINTMLCELLTDHGFLVVGAYSGTEALLALDDDIALVLLDLMLPGLPGEQVLTRIRATSSVPIIVLTARMDKTATVELLRLGADDYLVKPFDNAELLARIEAQLRRAQPALAGQVLRHGDLVVDLDRFDAFIGGRAAGLTKREFDVLCVLMSHPTKVFTKTNLYEAVWGVTYMNDDNTINVHMSKLRAKLAKLDPGGDYVQTVWGIGFRMTPRG